MKYQKIRKATFLERPNRFLAYAELDGERVKCHVKNTGRCKELLIPQETIVYLEDHGKQTQRKTQYSLVQVEKNGRLINMDSQAPNQLMEEWLQKGELYSDLVFLKREVTFQSSRFDFYYERACGLKGFIEVKGVTLEEDHVARFPDAPTQRGVKHIYELMEAVKAGYEANLIFVVQMKGIKHLEPNDQTHPAFGEALRQAARAGVHVMAVDCLVQEASSVIDQFLEVQL